MAIVEAINSAFRRTRARGRSCPPKPTTRAPKMCLFWARGSCRLGSLCRFSHGFFKPMYKPAGEPQQQGIGVKEALEAIKKASGDLTPIPTWDTVPKLKSSEEGMRAISRDLREKMAKEIRALHRQEVLGEKRKLHQATLLLDKPPVPPPTASSPRDTIPDLQQNAVEAPSPPPPSPPPPVARLKEVRMPPRPRRILPPLGLPERGTQSNHESKTL